MIYYLQKKRCVSWTHAETFGSLGKGTVSAPPFQQSVAPFQFGTEVFLRLWVKMPTVFRRAKKTSQWWHRDATVRLRSPKGDIWKQTLLKKSVTFYTNPAMWLWVAKFDHRKVRILVWSNPCSSWHPPPTLLFAANVAAVTSASQSIVATQASVWTAHVPRITWTKWWMTGKIRKPHQVWMVKKMVSLVFSCRLCLKKTTRSVNLSLPIAIFRHKVLKGLYQRTGTPVMGGDGHPRYCHFSWWLTHGIRLYMYTIPDFCTDPDVVSSVLGNTLTLCNKTVISHH